MMALPLRGKGRLKFLWAARVPHARPPHYACRAAILVRMFRSMRPASEAWRGWDSAGLSASDIFGDARRVKARPGGLVASVVCQEAASGVRVGSMVLPCECIPLAGSALT